jgi:voltage-gated potassium channel
MYDQEHPVPDWLNPDYKPAAETGWRAYCFRVIFGHDLPDERLFDGLLLLVIAVSVAVAILDTVGTLHARWGTAFYAAEWAFTILFAIEYVVRLLVVKRTLRYALSFYGLIDLTAVLPTFVSLIVPGADHLLVIRVLRVLRVFRIFQMANYSRESSALVDALYNSRRKIGLFVFMVLLVTVIFGALMFLIEGPGNGFTSIPRSMYWAIVTMATVGFGDIAPSTALGQFVTSIIVLIGYGIIAVPTGIFGAELIQEQGRRRDRQANELAPHCPRCRAAAHDSDANYCHRCGERMFQGAPAES